MPVHSVLQPNLQLVCMVHSAMLVRPDRQLVNLNTEACSLSACCSVGRPAAGTVHDPPDLI